MTKTYDKTYFLQRIRLDFATSAATSKNKISCAMCRLDPLATCAWKLLHRKSEKTVDYCLAQLAKVRKEVRLVFFIVGDKILRRVINEVV